MKLIALKEIPDSVVMIMTGQIFIEPNPEQANYWVKYGFAASLEPIATAVKLVSGTAPVVEAPLDKEPLLLAPPAPINSRGWDGLFWDGATVCIMASGPSMSEEQSVLVQAWHDGGAHRVMTVNTTFRLAPWAEVLYACDGRWWEVHNQEVVANCSSQLWTQDVAAMKFPGMHLIKSERKQGLGKQPGMIHQGMSSGFQAINLAYQAGAKKILLLGFDCRNEGKKTHWHGDHEPPLNSSNPFAAWLKNFDILAADLQVSGVEVVNCTPRSALTCFRTQKLEEALAVVNEGGDS